MRSWLPVKPLLRYGNSSTYNIAAVRYLEYVLRSFGAITNSIWCSLSSCKILLESMKWFR